MDIAAIMRAGRRSRRISQRQLAERAGLPHCTVDRIEAERADPRLSTIERLLGALDLRLAVVTCNGAPFGPDPEREQLFDFGGRHFPPHWEIRDLHDEGDWWGDTRKRMVNQPRPRYTLWRRNPPIPYVG